MTKVQKLILYTVVVLLLPSIIFCDDKVTVSVAGSHETIRAFSQNNLTYISISELAEIVGGTLSWEKIGHKVRYHDPTFSFEFLLESPFFVMNDTTYNMVYGVQLKRGQLYAPAVTFLPFLDRVTAQKIIWDKDRKLIRIESEYFNVTDMTVQSKANGLLIDIYLSSPVTYDAFVTEGNWLNISIRDARINRNRILTRKDRRFMYRLKVHQIENNTGQISIRLKHKIEKWQHKLAFDPTRIQITIADVNFDINKDRSDPVIGPDNKIDVIVIDPGHGGADYGAIGPGGKREKDISLSISKRLSKLIRKDKQFKVIMTRDRDKALTLQQRANIANKASADLFVSIHANASTKRYARGWNVFFLAPALNDSARAVEQLENSPFLRESSSDNQPEISAGGNFDNDPVLSILNEMIMTEFQAESYDFAQLIDREFRRRLKIPARGIDQAGFFVLNKVFTPSVLVETGFISNKKEVSILTNKKFQKKLARGIYEAIKRFKQKYESK